jgi:3-oxoisoapionate kinase
LLGFYGDDFTGSTDVMESLTYGGIETVLFVNPHRPGLLDDYPDARAIGIAGRSRAMSPDEMEEELPSAFAALLKYEPAIVHYKTCSTFDSSPTAGSIGRAIDIASRMIRNNVCPLVVGAPVLQRFCVFGNLFARSGLDSAPYRLDRHPTMQCHPVTPMNEADLRLHLSQQTDRPVCLIDLLMLNDPGFDWRRELKGHEQNIILFDTLTDAHLQTIGKTLWEMKEAETGPLFVAGSSGVEYALTSHWRSGGIIDRDGRRRADDRTASSCSGRRGKSVDQILVVSGSCSPVTDRQIGWAVEQGFAEIGVDTPGLHHERSQEAEVRDVVSAATAALQEGRSVIVHNSRGPTDPRFATTTASAETLGKLLGRVVRGVLARHPLQRIAVTGGDTSGHVARELEIDALQIVGPLAPGSPLCVARSSRPQIDGLEMTFKGGQVGHDNFFEKVLAGNP